jgi:hypothetical protein
LSATEIAEIYNQSYARFHETGNHTINATITSGDNRVNVSTNMTRQPDTNADDDTYVNLSLKIQHLAGAYSAPQNISNLTNYTFTIDSSATKLNLTYEYISNASRFWSPILMRNITFNTFTEGGVGDTIPPNVTIWSPSDNSNFTGVVNFTINATDETGGVDNCSVSIDTGVTNNTMYNSTHVDVWNYTEPSASSDGSYTAYFYCRDDTNNLNNTESVSYKIDSTPPTINITSPYPNNTNTSDNTIDVEYTRSDATTNIESCWYSNDTNDINFSLGSAGVCVNITNITWSEGSHDVFIYINDSANNLNYTRINFTIDTIAPLVNITTPANNTNTTDNTIDVEYTWVESGTAIESCWYSNDTNDINFSLGSGGVCVNITNITWSEGSHDVFIYVNDSANNVNQTRINFTIDTIPPFINITSPVFNNTNQSDNTLDVEFHYSGDIPHTCWYSNDTMTVNLSTPCGTNITNLTWLEGDHIMRVYINDSAGNENMSTVGFTVDTLLPYFSTIPANETIEFSIEDLEVNFIGADDGSGVNDSYAVNDSTNFKINTTGTLENNTVLAVGTWFVNITITDYAGNMNETEYKVTVEDTRPPTMEVPGNKTIEYKIDNLNALFNASDPSGLDNWTINDTTNFEINSTGWVVNISSLNLATYYINVSVNDTIGNANETLFQIDVTDTTQPTFDNINNISIYTNQSVQGWYNASDHDAVDSWMINDTVNFNINNTGYLSNVTTLSVGTYFINVTINDSSNNPASYNVNVTVNVEIDYISPFINITQPFPNNTNQSDNTLDIEYVFTDETGMDSCWYSNDTYAINLSLGSGGTCVNITNITWAEGNHNVTIYVNDTQNNLNFTSISFEIDTIAPAVNITEPLNNTNTTDTQIGVNFTYSDTGTGISSCWYSNTSGVINYTLTCGNN